MAMVFGYNPPFFGGPQNVMSRQEDEKIIKNDLLQLLLTVPGERVYDLNFGVNLRSMVFDQMEEGTIETLRQEIYNKVTTYEPRVNLSMIDIRMNDPGNAMIVQVVGSLKNDPNTVLNLEIPIEGSANGR
jgi:phage baseplate assembly protein W